MPSVSGNLSYAQGRFAGLTSLTGIPNIPIVIQDTTSGVGIGVLTDVSGNYTINAVPAGNYRLVESYGFTGAVASPATFPVTTIPVPVPGDPPLSAIAAPIAGTNQVDSMTPNTILVTMGATTITAQNFVDSSIRVNPITLPVGTNFGSNLLTYAGNGIWGTLPAGSFANVTPTTYPYANSMVSSLLTYTNNVANLDPLGANYFSMSNINTVVWFYAPNHTTFDETSSYLLVNGGDPNALLFQETVSISPNTFYLASTWMMMITDFPNTCLLGFRVLAQDGVTVLFYGQRSDINFGQWDQIGQIFNTANNNQVTVQVLSMSNVGSGNDFAIDDVRLQLVSFDGNVTFHKYVDKPLVTVGSSIKYTSVVTTNINLFNLRFQDTIPSGTSFTAGTVNVDGTSYPSYSPVTGFTLPDMSGGSMSTITFNVTVTTPPSSGRLDNVSNFTYSAAIIAGNTITDTVTSETVSTAVQFSKLDSIKSVDKAFAVVGDTLVYTVTLVNAGNVTAGSAVFRDTIPNGTTFVNNSLSLNGSIIPGANPQSSISLGTMPVGVISTINFYVLVNTVPSPNPIPNSSYTSYTYLVDPTIGFIPTDVSNSNIVTTRVNDVSLDIQKSVDYIYANVGTTLTYTIAFSNLGNITANNVVLMDTIPFGTSFLSGSVNINGVTSLTANPALPGINLNFIGPNARTTVRFNVLVAPTIPYPISLPNNSQLTYNYFGAGSTVFTQATSNIVITTLSTALITTSKSVNKLAAVVGDVLTYTIPITNLGTTIARSITFLDTVPSGTTFVPNSLRQDGAIIPGTPNPPGATLNNISPGVTSTVSFQTTVTTLPSSGLITNSANINYTYIVDPATTPIIVVTTSTNTNTVTTSVNSADLSSIVKSVSRNYTDLNTTITYTVAFTNLGNITANNVVFMDTVPSGSTFVTGSVNINGVNSITANPALPGMNLGSIGTNIRTTITFNVIAAPTVPYPNSLTNNAQITYNYTASGGGGGTVFTQATSNFVVTTISGAVISTSKRVNKTFATIGDVFNYTLPLTNSGTTIARNVIFVDTLANGLTFVTNSIRQDGAVIPGNPASPGVTLNNIAPNTTSTVSFQAIVTSIPSSGVITNTGSFNYTYTVDSATTPIIQVTTTTNTNTVTTTISAAVLSTMSKGTDKYYARCGDIVTFTITIPNSGNATAINVIFTDTIPPGTTFVSNSVTVNGTAQPGATPIPPAGINIGNIAPGSSTVVTFRVTVTC